MKRKIIIPRGRMLSFCAVSALMVLNPAWAADSIQNCAQVISVDQSDADSTDVKNSSSAIDALWNTDPASDSTEDDEDCAPITLERIYDFGDVPDSYGTTTANDGAFHEIVPGLMIGGLVDEEADGQPTEGADGDDLAGSTLSDEDGYTVPTLQDGETVSLSVDVKNGTDQAAQLVCWIDYDGQDGFEADEAGLVTVPVSTDSNGEALLQTLTVNMPEVPAGSYAANVKADGSSYSYARCRLSTDDTLTVDAPTGEVIDGEVEDRKVLLTDTPEFDLALKKELTDPDASYQAGDEVAFTITVYNQGDIDATDIQVVDYIPEGMELVAGNGWTANADGTIATLDAPIASLAVGADPQVLSLTLKIKDDASAGELINAAEITAANDNEGKPAADVDSVMDGDTPVNDDMLVDDEIGSNPEASVNPDEDDHDIAKLTVDPEGTVYYDYGDAPDPDFPTLADSEGARHLLGTDVYLGACVDGEVGDTADNADSDDTAVGTPLWGECQEDDDEDGVTVGELIPGAEGIVEVVANADCKLNAWIDWNADGDWIDQGEQVFVDELLGAGGNALAVNVPDAAVEGEVYARFRCSTDGGDEITGEAADGEVEDYKLAIGTVPEVPKYSVGNQIWVDNGAGTEADANNGFRDELEALFTGSVQLELLDSDGNVLEQTVSEDGYYLFSGLEAGSYKVCVTADNFASGGVLEGYLASTGGDETDPNKDVDENDNGSNDPLAGLCSGVVVLGDDAEPTGELPTASGAEGDDGKGTSDYRSNLTVDFGVVPPPVEPPVVPPVVVPDEPVPMALGNLMWLDTNADGQQDTNEPGLPGVTVTLTTADGSAVTNLAGQTVGAMTTDSQGYYLFENLPEGDYIVSVTPPADYYLSPGGDDVDDNASDQDSNCSAPQSDGSVNTLPVTLEEGTEPDTAMDGDNAHRNMTVDCGFYQSVSVGDRVWGDENADGQQENSEPGISGVAVTLLDADGLPVIDVNGLAVEPVLTDSDGNYRFDNLRPGEYSVTFEPPEDGYSASPGKADPDEDSSNTDSNCFEFDGLFRTTTFVLPDSYKAAHNPSVDCGLYRPVGVGNRIWIDLDGDGQQESGEPGVPGATVSIKTPDGEPATNLYGNVIPPQTTGPDGGYFFGDLREGDYVIEVTPPIGYVPTVASDDPDDNQLSDSNGVVIGSSTVGSHPITLSWGDEPDDDGDSDKSTNLTVGFGFVPSGENLQIPTASTWTLGLMSALLSMVAFWRRRRDD